MVYRSKFTDKINSDLEPRNIAIGRELAKPLTSKKTIDSIDAWEEFSAKTIYLIRKNKLRRAKTVIKFGLKKFPNKLDLLILASDVCRASGNREKSLEYAELLITHHPDNWNGYGRAAQDLIVLKRFEEAQDKIQAGLEKIPSQINLLNIATDIYRTSGDPEKSLAFSELLISHFPDSWTGYIRAAQDELSLGIFQPFKWQERIAICQPPSQGKDLIFWESISNYKNTAIESLWVNSFKPLRLSDCCEDKISLELWQPFQYWSQGRPPNEIINITKAWNKLFKAIGVSPIKMFDKNTALEYIENNCPELSISFKTSFHYAVEADVFRLAYAQRNNCIWLDSDMYPRYGTKDMLKELLSHRKTTLYFREKRPWIVNGFFASPSGSKFFANILNSTKDTDFSTLPHNFDSIVNTFGPRRYNQELDKILKTVGQLSDQSSVEGVQAIKDFNFVNEHTFASVNPPFKLHYKTTNDSWHLRFPSSSSP